MADGLLHPSESLILPMVQNGFANVTSMHASGIFSPNYITNSNKGE